VLLFEYGSASRDAPEERFSRPLILAHDMPWFESNEISGGWGWHWTGGTSNPDTVEAREREHRITLLSSDWPVRFRRPRCAGISYLAHKIAGIVE